MFIQLNPPLPMHVLGKGEGYAIGMIDYGQEHNLLWVTALNESGEIWCAPNPQVRMAKNWSMGRKENPLIAADKARAAAKGKNAGLCADCADVLDHARG